MKICGITREDDLDCAVRAGADAVGFVSGFPTSPRNVSLERAGELARRAPASVLTVLVTDAATLGESAAEVRATGVRGIQLYGDGVDPADVRRSLGVSLIRPYPVRSADALPTRAAVQGFDALLTEAYAQGLPGGTGRVSDWPACRGIRDALLPTPVILSGGLTPENVAQGIESVRPYAVDVSSGVESSPGSKDPGKIASFVSRAREALAR